MKKSICLVLALSLFQPEPLLAQQGGQADYKPPLELRLHAKANAGSGGLRGDLPERKYAYTTYLDTKGVHIEWKYWIDSVQPAPEETKTQFLPTGFYPTAVCGTEDFGVFLVAGSTKLGYTKIVLYAFQPPEYLDGVLYAAQLTDVEPLALLPPTHAQRDVYHLFRNHGSASETVFVEFWNTREVHELDPETGVLSLRVAPAATSSPGVLVEPALLMPHEQIYESNHVTHGFLYYISGRSDGFTLPYTPIIRDQDRDGVLDDILHASATNTTALELDDPSKVLW